MGKAQILQVSNPYLQILAIVMVIQCFNVSVAEIRDTRILSDSRPMIFFERFGFTNTGHAYVAIKNVSWKLRHGQSELDPTSMGFFLLTEASHWKIMNEYVYTQFFCITSSQYILPLFNLTDLELDYSHNSTIQVMQPDEYTLVFGNCQPEFEIIMDVHTEMYNMDGDVRDFLPSGQTQLPILYLFYFVIYCLFIGLWINICMRHRMTMDKIHVIMGGLLFVKALKLGCAAEDQYFVKMTGTPHGWDIAFYVFGFFKGIMLFTVIVLIGTGWSFLKPYLQEREKKVLMVVIPLQVLENMASVVIGESGPFAKDWIAWNHIFLIIDLACCCAIVIPIIWSIRTLREALKTDGKAARNLEKLTLFRQFYMVVVGYLYFTRIVVSAIGSLASYRYEWIKNLSEEGASLAFYVFVFYKFRPLERNPYFLVDDDEGKAVAELARALEDEDEFEL
ncbi:protein GPR107 [Amborella trichopoda]|uniref:Protein GPR107 n=1 Tax=Amborella trichopoda TaxID=13333 RepID=U5D085_AMBTC|nr:protein GPR107 [Amborella trichopoda]ERN15839.1 hypothetical protein AMTR_s00039p00168460 [Amborella trichopoda]|eukprot:XP_006854372.1 protein GPR107 [Amborella trichopoda]